MHQLPRAVWRYRLSALEVADLGDGDRLARVGLAPPMPGRKTWRPFQTVGEQLWREGWPGLVAPSAARPDGRACRASSSTTRGRCPSSPSAVRASSRNHPPRPPACGPRWAAATSRRGCLTQGPPPSILERGAVAGGSSGTHPSEAPGHGSRDDVLLERKHESIRVKEDGSMQRRLATWGGAAAAAIVTALVLIVSTALAGGGGSTAAPLLIAVEGPQSGAQAANGVDQLRGVRLAVRPTERARRALGRPQGGDLPGRRQGRRGEGQGGRAAGHCERHPLRDRPVQLIGRDRESSPLPAGTTSCRCG